MTLSLSEDFLILCRAGNGAERTLSKRRLLLPHGPAAQEAWRCTKKSERFSHPIVSRRQSKVSDARSDLETKD